jgi:hypothetical protein
MLASAEGDVGRANQLLGSCNNNHNINETDAVGFNGPGVPS